MADGTQRWWDGATWTAHVAPRPSGGGDDNTLALVAHLGGAFGSIVVPIVIYFLRRDQSPYVRHHAAEAINFHITLFLYSLVSFVLMLVLIGFVLLLAVIVVFYVFTIMASIAASRGEWYRYPLTLHLVS